MNYLRRTHSIDFHRISKGVVCVSGCGGICISHFGRIQFHITINRFKLKMRPKIDRLISTCFAAKGHTGYQTIFDGVVGMWRATISGKFRSDSMHNLYSPKLNWIIVFHGWFHFYFWLWTRRTRAPNCGMAVFLLHLGSVRKIQWMHEDEGFSYSFTNWNHSNCGFSIAFRMRRSECE